MATRVAQRPPARPTAPAAVSLGVLPRRQLTGIIPALLCIAFATAVTGLNAVRPFTDLVPVAEQAGVRILLENLPYNRDLRAVGQEGDHNRSGLCQGRV